MRSIAICRAALLWGLAPLALLSSPALAADATFATEAGFVAAAGVTAIESFESLAGSARALLPIAAPLLTITTESTPLGVQVGPDSPSSGFGAAATDGTHYVSVYAPGVPQGTIRIDLAGPVTAFGFNIVDVGEIAGTLVAHTDAGAFAAGTTLATFNGTLGSGNVQFFGLTQDLAFSTVYLTVSGVDDAYGLDKLHVAAVPEPASAWTLLGGLAGLGAWRARRRRATPISCR